MSPLTDVTNIAEHEPILETQCGGLQRGKTKKISRYCSRLPCSEGQSEVHEVGCYKSLKRRTEPEAINMCNIQVTGNEGSKVCQHCDPRIECDVPLLPHATDILLSHAVQTLNLSQNSVKASLQSWSNFVQQRKNLVKIPENKQNAKTVKTANCGGLPEIPGTWKSGNTPQQCGACGLEFTSLPVLTQHLARHVYDGLYAAQWLTQAMHLVSRQPSSALFSYDDRDSTSDVVQRPSLN